MKTLLGLHPRQGARFTGFALGALVLAFGHAGNALAQSASNAQGLLENRFVVNVGAFVMGRDTKASLDGQAGENQQIDFDKVFGSASDKSRGRIDALWRITPKHHLRLMYFRDSTDRSAQLSEQVKWGDVTYDVGAQLNSSLKFETYELAYEYAFMRQPTYEVSASAGLHISRVRFELAGVGTVTDPGGSVSTPALNQSSDSLTAPLPVLGLRAGWAITPQIHLDAQAQIFKISLNGVDGHWSDLRIGATWMFHRNWGVGLGYNRFNAVLDADRSGFRGNADFSYSGLQAYLTSTF